MSVDPLLGVGGLFLWWNHNVDIEILSKSRNLIDTIITVKIDHTNFRATWFYGPPYQRNKSDFWREIMLRPRMNIPWICLGDFNELISNDEKSGGNPHAWNHPHILRDFMDNLGLLDLGFKGQHFTWDNRRDGEDLIWERLDRAVANALWINKYIDTVVEHSACIGSGHYPLIVGPIYVDTGGAWPFKFKDVWLNDTECEEIVKHSWSINHLPNAFSAWNSNLNMRRRALISWSRVCFPNYCKHIAVFMGDLAAIQATPTLDWDIEKRICEEMGTLGDAKDCYTKQ